MHAAGFIKGSSASFFSAFQSIIAVMDTRNEKEFTWKLIIVVILCLMILFGFLFLILSGNASFIPGLKPKPDDAVDIVTPDSTESPDTETVTPEITDIIEPTETPDTQDVTDDPVPEETTPDSETEEPDPEPSDEPEPTPETTPETKPKPSKDVDVYSDDSIQRIVNKDHLLPADYVPSDLVVPDVPRNGNRMLRKEAAAALEEMFAAAEEDGIYLYLASGYRSYADQRYLYNYYLQNRGEEWTSHVDAYPGGSEHQTGLSVDLSATDHVCEIYKCFSETDTFKWLQAHSWEYGYIERNPEDSEQYTGIQFSPWNFRYVGKEEAEKLHSSGLTMEQYYFGDE